MPFLWYNIQYNNKMRVVNEYTCHKARWHNTRI